MAPQPTHSSNSPTAAMGLRQQIAFVQRYAWFIGLVLLIAIGATLVLTQRQEKIYSSSARVLLRTTATESLFPFAATGARELIRTPSSEVLFTQTPEFLQKARDVSPPGAPVSVRSDGNEIVFTARGPVPEAVAAAASAWAETYVVETHIAYQNETQEGIEFLQATMADLGTERDLIRQEVLNYDTLLAQTTDPDQYTRILSQKVAIETLLQPQLAPIDAQITQFGRELADLQLITRFTDTPEVSARVKSLAGVPSSPVSPNLYRNLAVGGVLGLALGIALPYLRQTLNDKVADGGDVASTTGLPILATIPSFKGGKDAAIEVVERPSSIASERYRALLTAIEFASIGAPVWSISFTSAAAGDGKTTTAVNTAALAAAYKNVILIDADMRRPSVHKFVDVDRDHVGLADVLTGKAEFHDARVAYDDGHTRFDVLTSGGIPEDPAQLLRGDAWPELLDKLFLYDLVIIDAPPAISVTDAVLIGRSVGGQILLSRSGATTRQDLAEAGALLATNGSRILGVVVNHLKTSQSRYSYYGEYDAGSRPAAPERVAT